MRTFRVLMAACVGLAVFPVASFAASTTYPIKDGNTNPRTVLAFACGTDTNGQPIICPAYVPTDMTGAAFGVAGNPFFVAPIQDTRPAAGAITVVDTASITASGQSGVSIVTGTPTIGSIYTQAINGQAVARIGVTGVWTGTLTFEGSLDGGVTWVAQTARFTGTGYAGSSVTGNGIFSVDVDGLTNFRVRATAAMTGSAVLQATFSVNPGFVQVNNPIRLFDNASGQQATIKPASTGATASDPSIATNESPNSQISTTTGLPTDTPYAGTGNSTLSAALRGIYAILSTINTGIQGAIAAGTNYIGQIGIDPSKGGGTPSSAPINISTATTTQLVAASGSTSIYVTSFDVIAGGTGNITFEYGTGTNCGTGTTVLTGAYPLAAQAGISKGAGSAAVLKVPSGNALCALTSAAVQVSGSLSYQQF